MVLLAQSFLHWHMRIAWSSTGLVPCSRYSTHRAERVSTAIPRVVRFMQRQVWRMARYSQGGRMTMCMRSAYLPPPRLPLLLIPIAPAGGPARTSATPPRPDRKLFLAIPGVSTPGARGVEELPTSSALRRGKSAEIRRSAPK